MSFPSLRLPLVVLSIIFNCMRPEEIIRFSFLSKRCYALTKALKKKPKRGLDIMFCSYASIEFLDSFSTRFEVSEFSDIPEDAQLEFLVIGGVLPCFVSMNRKRDGMDIYCQYDRFDGLTALLKYIIDFYKLPIENISIGADKQRNDPKRALDWVFSQQETLNECYFDCDMSGDEELKCFFDRIGNRVEKFLGVLTTSNVGENFRYTFRQPITPDSIEFGDVLWLTIDNLFSLNSRCLSLHMTNLTSEDMNFFLVNWLLGGNSNLRYMSFEMKLIDVDVIFNGLEVIERDHFVEYRFNEDETERRFTFSYELTRYDGTIASVLLGNRSFCMCVWPDFNGKSYPVQELEE
ncbi:unnamed protein product [Caenorhabditis brenneri]